MNSMSMMAETAPKPHDDFPLSDGVLVEPPPGEVTTTAGEALLVLPEESLAVTVSVWLPAPRLGNVTLQAPLPLAVVVAINTPPS